MKTLENVKHFVAVMKRKLRRQLEWYFLYSPEERRHAWVGNGKLWKMKRDFQIQFLQQVGLQPHHFLLDLGCGTLRGGIPLIDYLETGHYFGIEARAEVLDEGRKELREANLTHKKPTLMATADSASLNLEQKFDFLWAFSVLIHLNDRILNDSLGFVQRHLADHGFFYANVNCGERPNGKWQGFPVVHRSLPFYEDACSRNGLRVEDIGPLTDFGHHLPGATIEQQATRRMLKIQKA
jgi:SAM-dependent methyltransferase